MSSMTTLKAVVQHGRLTLDEPTALPEGTVIELEEVDPYRRLDSGDDLDDEERAELHEALDRSLAQVQRGEYGRPIDEVLKSL